MSTLTKTIALGLLLMAVSARGDECIIDMYEKGSGTYYVQGSIPGAGDTEFLVDTGSGYAVISQDLIEALLLKEQATFLGTISGTLANGSTLTTPIFRIAEIHIGACRFKDIEAAMFPKGVHSILGMEVLKQGAPFSFSFNPPRLTLSQR